MARSQAAKALKKRGGKEEIPLTVFNIIEVWGGGRGGKGEPFRGSKSLFGGEEGEKRGREGSLRDMEPTKGFGFLLVSLFQPTPEGYRASNRKWHVLVGTKRNTEAQFGAPNPFDTLVESWISPGDPAGDPVHLCAAQ